MFIHSSKRSYPWLVIKPVRTQSSLDYSIFLSFFSFRTVKHISDVIVIQKSSSQEESSLSMGGTFVEENC